MQIAPMGVGKTVFPGWTAAVTLVKNHGTDAASHAAQAVKAGSARERLEHAVLAMTSFDHAVDNVQKLPVRLLVGGSGAYFRGYEAARRAVGLIVASGVVPGAKELVGRQSLVAARDAFLAGVQVNGVDRSRFGGRLATGWLEASSEDAREGVKLLAGGDPLGRTLLTGVDQVRAATSRRTLLDPLLVRTVTDLFDRVGARLDEAATRAEREAATRAEREALDAGRAPAPAPVAGDEASRLLIESGDLAQQLLRDAAQFGRDLEGVAVAEGGR